MVSCLSHLPATAPPRRPGRSFVHMARYRLLVCGALVILAAGPLWSAPRADMSFPIHQTPDGQILVSVSVNGRPPVPFVLDTGSDRCTLDRSFAEALGLGPKNAATGPSAALGKLPEVTLNRVRISGDRHSWNQIGADIAAAPLSSIVGQPVSGFLGGNILQHYAVLLDFAGGHVSLYDHGISDAGAASLGFTRDHSTRGGLKKKPGPSEVTVPGMSMDTLAADGRIPAAVAKQADLKFAARLATIHGSLPVERTAGSGFTIAGWTLDGAFFFDAPTGTDASSKHLGSAVGIRILSRFSRVLLDNVRKQAWYGPPLEGDDSASGAVNGPPKAAVSLPLQRLASGQVLIPIRVDGRLPAQFVLDTGSATSVLDRASFTVSAGSRVFRSDKPGGWAWTILDSLQIAGDTRVWHRLIAVRPEAALPAGPPATGVLGLDVLKHYTVLLDFARGRIVLYRRGVSDAGAASLGFSKGHVSPIQCTARTSISGHRFTTDAPLDTGADISKIASSLSDLLMPRDDSEYYTMYGAGEVRTVELPSMGIAGWKLRGPLTLVAPYSDPPPNPALAPAIGMDILSRFSRVLLDFPRNRAWFGPPLPHAVQNARPANSNGFANDESASDESAGPSPTSCPPGQFWYSMENKNGQKASGCRNSGEVLTAFDGVPFVGPIDLAMALHSFDAARH